MYNPQVIIEAVLAKLVGTDLFRNHVNAHNHVAIQSKA